MDMRIREIKPISTVGGYYDNTILNAPPYKNLSPCNESPM